MFSSCPCVCGSVHVSTHACIPKTSDHCIFQTAWRNFIKFYDFDVLETKMKMN